MSHFTTEIEYSPVTYQRQLRRVIVMMFLLGIAILSWITVGSALVVGNTLNTMTGVALAALGLLVYALGVMARDAVRQHKVLAVVRSEVLQSHHVLLTYMNSYLMPMNLMNAPFIINIATTVIKDSLLMTVTHDDPTMNKWVYRLSKTTIETHREAPAFRQVFPDLCGVMEDVGDRRAQRVATLSRQFRPLDINEMDIPKVTSEQREARALMGDD